MREVRDKFSVIMPVLNGKAHLRASLDSIMTAVHGYGNVDLIVLDNGSNDGSYEILLNEYGSRVTLRQVRDMTVAGLRNCGARLADGEFLAFIDSDCEIVPDYFEQALRVLRTCADITGAKCALDDSPHWIEKTWYEMHVQRQDGTVSYINSGNLVLKRQAFLRVNGFDERMVGCEDADLCERLIQAGFKIFQAHAVCAIHHGGDKTLGVFFRKHAWRSLGMFGMLKNTWMSKPLLMTFAQLFLCIAATASLFVPPTPIFLRLVYFILLVNVAPLITILYRAWQVKRPPFAPVKAILLYHVYFFARFYAIWKLVRFSRASLENKCAIGARLRG